MKRMIWLAALGVIILGAEVFAEAYTLDQCIEMARKTDPNLIRFRNAVKTVGSEVWWRAGQFLPSVSVSGSYRKVDQGVTSEKVVDLGGGVIEVLRPGTQSVSMDSIFRARFGIILRAVPASMARSTVTFRRSQILISWSKRTITWF